MDKIFIRDKVIERRTWRYLGQRCNVESPHDVPIAGSSIIQIQHRLNGNCYKIGRTNIRNAFLVIVGTARLLYVKPQYASYRKIARRVFSPVDWEVDYDHALAKSIAMKAEPRPCYVLLLRVPPGVNRQHGLFEKLHQLPAQMPEICLADVRVWDKWLGRPPKARNRCATVMAGYSPLNAASNPLGLTLKQMGRWAYAIGMGDDDLPMDGLTRFIPDC